MTDNLFERAMRVARVDSVAELIAAVLMLASYPLLLLVAVLFPSWGAFVGLCVISYLSDHYLHRRGSYLISVLSRVRAGVSLRFLVRQLLLVLLLSRMDLAEDEIALVAIGCFIVFFGLQAPHSALITRQRLRRKLPIVSRNVDLAELAIADAPPRWLLRRATEKMQHLDLPAMAGVLVAVRSKDVAYGYAGVTVTLALALLYMAMVFLWTRSAKLPPKPAAVLEWFDTWLCAYLPTTVLYFSGSKDSAYQVNMWLETLQELEGRPLILLRERHTLAALAPTSVPVLCVPSAVHVMNLDLSTVKVALYPANVGNNIHLLRAPTMKHVFVGHGDSDKVASINPYSKVYDEVWTAGKAGRDRYALANVGVRDDSIVEVGRPQLAPIDTRGARKHEDAMPTVLYAPTWEGWTDEPGNTSLILAGENIVRRLLTASGPVRVLYKPHPFTGIRSAAAKAADRRIRAMIERANTERTAMARWAGEAASRADEFRSAREELTRVDAEIERLTARSDSDADEAQTARDATADPAKQAELTRLHAARNDAYWRSFGWWEHRTVTGPWPPIYDCFNRSDAMVSDISSVVSDFLASGKPYAVTDSAGLGAKEFKRQNTAVRAAVILSNDAKQLDALLEAVADPESDPLAAARQELKQYLLGPDEPPSIVRFGDAVRTLAAQAERRNLECATWK